MKKREFVLLLVLGTVIFGYGAWYSFNFIDPAMTGLLIFLYILILIYLPYHKIKNNNESNN